MYDFLAETRNYSIVLAFIASSLNVTQEDWLSETDLSGPPSVFWMFSLLLKVLIFIFLLVVTAAGVVPCDITKKPPRASSTVQFILHLVLWDQQKYSEKSENIICLDLY